MNFNKSLFILFSVSLALLLSVGLALPAEAGSASLYLSPSTGNYTVGNTFSVQVKVNSGGVSINASDGVLVFEPDKLEVKSISKEDSVFSLWVQDPIFSNSLGTINFAGGKPSPGFSGAAGVIITITFKAKTTTDSANLTFASGSVLADDGKGTNILSNLGSGAYRLSSREISPILPTTPEYIPSAPEIFSSTHPDENKWYSNNAPEFNWKLPSDVTGVSLLLNQSPSSNPGSISDGLMKDKKFEDIEDGIWYFHIKFKNQNGWGKITHRQVLIDTQPPLPFEIKVKKDDPTDPQPVLLLAVADELSGSEYYEIKIGQGEAFPISAENIPYKLPAQAPGKHPIAVKAFDNAGNYALAALADLEILPIETPTITKIPKTLLPGQNLTVEGKGLPESSILLFIQQNGKELAMKELKADNEGDWSFTSPTNLEKGDYEIWAQERDKRGALSLPTDKFTVAVNLPPFLRFGTIAISYVMIMVTLIVLIAVAVGIIFYIWYRISVWQKRVRGETKEVSESVAKAFKALREEVEEQIEFLDGKPGLNKDERQVRNKLKEALDISEEFISKEVKDIEKELD